MDSLQADHRQPMPWRVGLRVELQALLSGIFEHHIAVTAAQRATERGEARISIVEPSAHVHKPAARLTYDVRRPMTLRISKNEWSE
ncbi:MAG TPA: hypothetical protein VGJ56_26445 [Reyranella sp.]|jgi:hypothetical protein